MIPPENPPPVATPADGTERPLWSVMIPTFNCAAYLRETLESVLSQDPGPEFMQIEVIDDRSTTDDPEAVVREFGNGRVTFHRKPQNEGAIANFNTCIERSRGELVHILHGDDWIAPGFYDVIGKQARGHPDFALYAARCYITDESGAVTGFSPRVPALEFGGRSLDDFRYGTPLQFAGVVIRRSFYEATGGFIPSLVHTADWEMWSRAIGAGGGIIHHETLAYYRAFAGNDTGRLAKTAENLRDRQRLNSILKSRIPGFDEKEATKRLLALALKQAAHFRKAGDKAATAANNDFWNANATFRQKLRDLFRGRGFHK